MILVDLDRVTVSRPGRELFTDISLTVSTGDRLGIVGLNGAGKTTLLRVLAGLTEAESGMVRRGREIRVAVLDQEAALPSSTVREALSSSWEGEAVLDRLGMAPWLDTPIDRLSGGQAKRVALARTLVSECDLLVLDEPTNHLDIDGIAWLEDRLNAFTGGLVIVSHDRHMLDGVTNRVVEIDRGDIYVHEGGYSHWLEARADRTEREATLEQIRRNQARRELAWLRRGAPARTSKPKARIEAASAIVNAKAPDPARVGDLPLHFDTPRLGDVVIELEGVGHGFEGLPLFDGVELRLDPRERLGVVGVNGTGKSTLLDIIAGRLQPNEGRVVAGTTARLGYYDQVGQDLELDARVWEVVTGGEGKKPEWWDKRLMEAFWFDSDAQFAPVRLLSGGERRRLQLLRVLAAKPNVLLLDEPTNDLDIDTLRALEDFLEEWPGALLVVSHDRAFLERTVADVVVLDGTGTVARRAGGYQAWEDERQAARKRGRADAGAAMAGGGGGWTEPTTKKGKPRKERTGRSHSTLRRLMKDQEKLITRLEKRQATLHAELTAAGSDHEALARIGAQVADVEGELATAEEEWFTLGAEMESDP
ncbi:MAG: ABC-F family ATP-binding cassette domain-containing protein [Actinomycetia bacterium]|nr:ABC-F family ATP-binding cassette domain-containing protein [Actinomycetes bacterium]